MKSPHNIPWPPHMLKHYKSTSLRTESSIVNGENAYLFIEEGRVFTLNIDGIWLWPITKRAKRIDEGEETI